MEKIKVLIVDDSALMRKIIAEILGSSPNIEVVGTALDPYIAVNKIKKLNPDIITLDIEMPRMDGLTFLSKLMISKPMPVIMVSSFTEKGANVTIKALEIGAVDFVCKPNSESHDKFEEFKNELIDKILSASNSKPKKRSKSIDKMIDVSKKFNADVILKKKKNLKRKSVTEKIIAIGASTGGTVVLEEILVNLGDDLPGILIAQHMPEKFTLAFAERVNGSTKLIVKEAKDGDRVYKGIAFIAPGGKHMLLKSDRNGYFIEINDGPLVNRHKPSVDVLFRSVCQVAGKAALGIICTGMGGDGAAGILEMKESGAFTIAQNEESSVVYGMPREAVKLGAIKKETNIKGIIEEIELYSEIS